MFKKSLLSLAVVLFLSSLFIPRAFASGLKCVPNGKLNMVCANGLSTPKLTMLYARLKQIYKAEPTKQNINNASGVLHILLGRKGFKSTSSYNKSK